MAVTAQTGVFSFGMQTGKGSVSTQFYKHYAADVDLGAISDDRTGPPEVGGVATPTLPYRAGTLATGGALINPRLQNTIGWLLYGATGANVVNTANSDLFAATVTGYTAHWFRFDTSNQTAMKWMSMRKYIPGTDSTTVMGETFTDCKIIALTLALPNDGLLSARIDVLGRNWEFTNQTGAAAFTYANTDWDSNASVPLSCVTNGYIKMPGSVSLPVVQATVTLANAPLDIRMEKVYGSPYLEDVTIVGRSVTFDLLCKWNDPYLYKQILTGTTTGTIWTSAPFVTDIDIYALSASTAILTTPYQLRIQAPTVMAQIVGGVRLAGNNALMTRIVGTAIQPSTTASHYVTIGLGNLIAAYPAP